MKPNKPTQEPACPVCRVTLKHHIGLPSFCREKPQPTVGEQTCEGCGETIVLVGTEWKRLGREDKTSYCRAGFSLPHPHRPKSPTPITVGEQAKPEQLFYIVCTKHPVGWNMSFWCPKACGYTVWLEDAGKYTMDEVKKTNCSFDHQHFPVPVEVIEALTHRAVDRDRHMLNLMREFVGEEAVNAFRER